MAQQLLKDRRRAPIPVILCLIGTSILCVGTSTGQTLPCTKTYAFDVNGNWHVDANWIPVGVPGPTDVACILEGGDFRVVVDAPATVAGVEVSGSFGSPELTVESAVFTLNGPGLVSGTSLLKLEVGAELQTDGGGVVDVHSNLKVEDSTIFADINLHGWLKVEGDSYLEGNLATFPGSMIIFEGTGGSWLTVAGGFDNNGEVAFGGGGDRRLTVTSGSFVNTVDGSLTTLRFGPAGAGTGTPTLQAEIVNFGLIDLNGVDLRIAKDGAEHRNEVGGSIEVAGAELEIDLDPLDVPSNFTNYGSITVADGGTTTVLGGSGPLDVPSNFTNYGSITVADGTSFQFTGLTPMSPMGVTNSGTIDLGFGADMTLVDANFDNPPDGEVVGDGMLDLTAAASTAFNGLLSPGSSPGILTIGGALEEGSSASVLIEIGGLSPGIDLDRLDVTGDLTAAGSLDVDLLSPYHPQGGEQYEILTFNQFLGDFDTIDLPPLQHLLVWNLVQAPQALWLEVGCEGTQVGIELVADNDPVSVGENVTYFVTVTNHSTVAATDVVVSDALPASLIFDQLLSSPECVEIGGVVECTLAELLPAGVWNLTIIAEAAVAGPITNTVFVDPWECDVEESNNQSTVLVNAVIAERCDANFDLSIDADDLVPSVDHIFGMPAPGNPDCRIGGGVTADDLSAIIEAGQ